MRLGSFISSLILFLIAGAISIFMFSLIQSYQQADALASAVIIIFFVPLGIALGLVGFGANIGGLISSIKSIFSTSKVIKVISIILVILFIALFVFNIVDVVMFISSLGMKK